MRGIVFAAFVVLLGGLTLLAAVAGDGSLAVALVPALLLGTLYAVARLPLRYPVFVATFLALTLENPADVPAAGLWRSPLYPVGTLLLAHMNLTFPSRSGCSSPGSTWSSCTCSRSPSSGGSRARASTASAAPRARARCGFFALVSLGGAAWMWAWGMARGGADVASSLWQMQRVAYLPLCYFLFELALRGPRDRRALGKVVVAAACVKAGPRALPPRDAGAAGRGDHASTTRPPTPTRCCSPARSASWSRSCWRGPRRAVTRWSCRSSSAGMIANHRRVVWVELAAGLALLARAVAVDADQARDRARRRRRLAARAPLRRPRGGARRAACSRPSQVVRSVVDSKADMSTEWRDLGELRPVHHPAREPAARARATATATSRPSSCPTSRRPTRSSASSPTTASSGSGRTGGSSGSPRCGACSWSASSSRRGRRGTRPRPPDRAAAIAAAAADRHLPRPLLRRHGARHLDERVHGGARASPSRSRLAAATGAWPRSAPSSARKAPARDLGGPGNGKSKGAPRGRFQRGGAVVIGEAVLLVLSAPVAAATGYLVLLVAALATARAARARRAAPPLRHRRPGARRGAGHRGDRREPARGGLPRRALPRPRRGRQLHGRHRGAGARRRGERPRAGRARRAGQGLRARACVRARPRRRGAPAPSWSWTPIRVVSPNLLRAFAARLDAGASAVQADYAVRNPDASWRTLLMAIALAAVHSLRSARAASGCACPAASPATACASRRRSSAPCPTTPSRSSRTSSTASASATRGTASTTRTRRTSTGRCPPASAPAARSAGAGKPAGGAWSRAHAGRLLVRGIRTRDPRLARSRDRPPRPAAGHDGRRRRRSGSPRRPALSWRAGHVVGAAWVCGSAARSGSSCTGCARGSSPGRARGASSASPSCRATWRGSSSCSLRRPARESSEWVRTAREGTDGAMTLAPCPRPCTSSRSR